MTAISYLVICSTLPSIAEVEDYSHLFSLQLADCSEYSNSDTIDVLKAQTFVTGEICKKNKGLIAVRSTLGWLLSGGVDYTHNGDTYTQLILTNETTMCIPEYQDPSLAQVLGNRIDRN